MSHLQVVPIILQVVISLLQIVSIILQVVDIILQVVSDIISRNVLHLSSEELVYIFRLITFFGWNILHLPLEEFVHIFCSTHLARFSNSSQTTILLSLRDLLLLATEEALWLLFQANRVLRIF